MIILQGNKIERSFSGDVLFDNINIQVDEKDRIALVGRNGAGKSTLLQILVSEEAPTSGEINTKRDLSLSYLAQDSRFESENTIFDEMLHVFDDVRGMESRLRKMEMQMAELTGDAFDKLMSDYDHLSEEFRVKGGFTYEAEIKAILNGFKFDESMWQMKISELSGGQNTRLALAKMLLEKPELLVLDEPTNHLDIETIAWLENYLVNYQGALIIVSHDRYFLDKVATVTLDLTKHSLDRYVGNYSKFMDLKAEKLALEAKNYEKQAKEIAKLEDFVQRNLVRASTTKRAQARRKQLEKMERLDKPSAGQKSANMTFHADKVSGNVVLTVADAAIGYDDQILSEPINIDVKKFDAIAIVGPNGIGKSTLIKSIVGQIPFIKGTSTYGASKAFVKQFSLNLRADLAGTKIRVTNIEPGLCEGTEFSNVRFKGDDERAEKLYEGAHAIMPEDIANTVSWVASQPEHVNFNRIEMMPVSQTYGVQPVYRD